jgi:hypothetical protein
MAKIKVYHNPEFLEYRGDHGQIPPPGRPVAIVEAPDALSPAEMLEFAYMKTQHGDNGSWYNNPEVNTHLRSTSVGDLIADAAGELHVVESAGFQPYQPDSTAPEQGLAEAQRALVEAVVQADTGRVLSAARQALAVVRQVLTAIGQPAGETPVLWEDARPGDLVSDRDGALHRVIARNIYPHSRAERLLAHIPDGQSRPDGEQAWAVLAPVGKEVEL